MALPFGPGFPLIRPQALGAEPVSASILNAAWPFRSWLAPLLAAEASYFTLDAK